MVSWLGYLPALRDVFVRFGYGISERCQPRLQVGLVFDRPVRLEQFCRCSQRINPIKSVQPNRIRVNVNLWIERF